MSKDAWGRPLTASTKALLASDYEPDHTPPKTKRKKSKGGHDEPRLAPSAGCHIFNRRGRRGADGSLPLFPRGGFAIHTAHIQGKEDDRLTSRVLRSRQRRASSRPQQPLFSASHPSRPTVFSLHPTTFPQIPPALMGRKGPWKPYPSPRHDLRSPTPPLLHYCINVLIH